jgi:hypothetical protein
MVAAWLHINGTAQRWWRPLQVVGFSVMAFTVRQTWSRGDVFANVDVSWIFWHCTLLGGGFATLIASCASMPVSTVLFRLLTSKFLLLSGISSVTAFTSGIIRS